MYLYKISYHIYQVNDDNMCEFMKYDLFMVCVYSRDL